MKVPEPSALSFLTDAHITCNDRGQLGIEFGDWGSCDTFERRVIDWLNDVMPDEPDGAFNRKFELCVDVRLVKVFKE